MRETQRKCATNLPAGLRRCCLRTAGLLQTKRILKNDTALIAYAGRYGIAILFRQSREGFCDWERFQRFQHFTGDIVLDSAIINFEPLALGSIA